MIDLLEAPTLIAFVQVVVIDLVLAGDNAVVIGMAAAGLPRKQRGRAIFVGIVAATILRILFASVATQLLAIVGLLLAGGILLLWVCWKMWREMRSTADDDLIVQETITDSDLDADGVVGVRTPTKTFGQAAVQIVVADISMSLDNVLAVAGAAHEHPTILVFGLILSVALMGAAASFVAGLLDRNRWIAYIGLLIILYVALSMTYQGAQEVWPYVV
ncbi:TerC family protein [Microbaculum marinum]|uniref:TerC family protein n=1 Tax=Microbaculum marinum TaxID=1764581 RepID=A0AAW9RD97_9HYPH